jgi:phosphotransferase system enzyme I (PtsI)
MTAETLRLRGRAAAPGLASGPLARLVEAAHEAGAAPGPPEAERAALARAIGTAASELTTLTASQSGEAAEILEFQIALLDDEDLAAPAFAEIDGGASALNAWERALQAQIADYSSAEDPYFRARACDLIDLRDRVARALNGGGESAPALPDESVLVAHDLPPSRFLDIDWTRMAGVALTGGSASSHVAMLARARGVPMVVGLGDVPASDGSMVLLDGEKGEIEIAPSASRLAEWRSRIEQEAERQAEESRWISAPALTRSGKRIQTLINIQGLSDLDSAEAAYGDGIGLVRTEFLFEPGAALPDESQQFDVYRRILEWAGARPVTIRTLDAGGDKPIPGVTFDGEANPFLGVRGLRLSLRRPSLFRTQLRALVHAAVFGDLRVMAPMVTTPGELVEARGHLDAALAELAAEGVAARRPPLGIMVEVPAAALTIDQFEADFYSIGSNDLVQYVTACDRGAGDLAGLADPLNPAVLELIRRTIAHGRETGASVSLCGDMAADPRFVSALMDCGLEIFSVAPPALGRLKTAIARYE